MSNNNNNPDGTVEGTAGDDLINLSYLGDPDGDRVDHADAILAGAAPNDDLILGFEGNDTVFAGTGDDAVYGGADDDRLFGELGNDSLSGDAGQDIAFGGAGNDALDGGAGNDTLKGGDGNDALTGGAGNDRLSGENDRDMIVAGGGDSVDGGAGGDDFDTLDLRGLGPYILQGVVPDSNGNGINGTVVFVDADGNPTGATINFAEIENLLEDDQNSNPDAVDDTEETPFETAVEIDVLNNDSDVNGDPLTVASASAANGTVTINPDGTLLYTPNDGFSGQIQ